MKNTFLILCICLIVQPLSYCQDSITVEDLQEFVLLFDIEQGQFSGKGGEVLKEAIQESHVTMLGENSGLKLEHQFTKTLLNELDKNNYKNMVLEVGGAAGIFINKLAKQNELTQSKIRKINQNYLLKKGLQTFIPILELRTIDAIKNIENAHQRNWEFFAVGLDPWTSYKLHVDQMYKNLEPHQKKANQNLYQQTVTLLEDCYQDIKAHNSDEVHMLISKIKSSSAFLSFMDKMSMHSQNKKIVEAINLSIDYYEMYGNKEYARKNIWNAQKDKATLKANLENASFDFNKDKLFVKMWRNHLGKGMAINGAFGVGNMLLEKASYHEKKSLTIAVVNRFIQTDEGVVDEFASESRFAKIYQDIIQLGKKDEWVLIDLRGCIEKIYYGNYIHNQGVFKMFSRYDMIVIPPLDEKAAPNY